MEEEKDGKDEVDEGGLTKKQRDEGDQSGCTESLWDSRNSKMIVLKMTK